ncbi:MAG: aminoacyl-tRNA deacylase [Dehalococcoidales bacterium]
MNLAAFLIRHQVYFEFLKKRPTRHALEASQVSGVALNEIVKTLVFVDQDAKPMIAVVRGDRNVSRHKLQYCSNSKSVRLASDEVAKAATGYTTGGIPPVGHKKKLPVFFDEGLTRHEYIWCGGGARSKLVRLRTEDIVKLSAATVCDIVT